MSLNALSLNLLIKSAAGKGGAPKNAIPANAVRVYPGSPMVVPRGNGPKPKSVLHAEGEWTGTGTTYPNTGIRVTGVRTTPSYFAQQPYRGKRIVIPGPKGVGESVRPTAPQGKSTMESYNPQAQSFTGNGAGVPNGRPATVRPITPAGLTPAGLQRMNDHMRGATIGTGLGAGALYLKGLLNKDAE